MFKFPRLCNTKSADWEIRGGQGGGGSQGRRPSGKEFTATTNTGAMGWGRQDDLPGYILEGGGALLANPSWLCGVRRL